MEAVRAEGCAKPLSKSERRFANYSRSPSPFDKLRANATRPDKKIANRLLGDVSIVRPQSPDISLPIAVAPFR